MKWATAPKLAHSVLACSSAASSFTVSWRCRHMQAETTAGAWKLTAAWIQAQVWRMKRPLFHRQIVAGTSSGSISRVYWSEGAGLSRPALTLNGALEWISAQISDRLPRKLRRCSATKEMRQEDTFWIKEVPRKRKCAPICPKLKPKLEFAGVQFIMIITININVDSRLT